MWLPRPTETPLAWTPAPKSTWFSSISRVTDRNVATAFGLDDVRTNLGVDAVDLDDYAAFTTLDGDELVLYRRTNDQAWIQSDTYVALEDER